MAGYILRVGDLAYLDALGGLLRCRVLNIRGKSGPASSEQSVTVKFTGRANMLRARGYEPGEKWTTWSLHVVPRAAIRRNRYSTRIMPYHVEG